MDLQPQFLLFLHYFQCSNVLQHQKRLYQFPKYLFVLEKKQEHFLEKVGVFILEKIVTIDQH